MSKRNAPFSRSSLLVSLVLVCYSGLTPIVQAQSKTNDPIKTTLCELLESPQQFNRKIVQLRPTMLTSLESSGLVDTLALARINPPLLSKG